MVNLSWIKDECQDEPSVDENDKDDSTSSFEFQIDNLAEAIKDIVTVTRESREFSILSTSLVRKMKYCLAV